MSARVVLAGSTPVNRRTTIQIAEKLLKKHSDGLDFVAPVASLTDSAIPQVVEFIGSWAIEKDGVRVFFITPPNTDDADEDSVVSDMGAKAIVKEAKVDSDAQFPAVIEAAVKYARKDTEDVVAIVWDEEDEEASTALVAAVARGVEARDLTNGFTVLTTDGDDEETDASTDDPEDDGEAGTDEEPEAEPVVEEKPKRAPRKTAAKKVAEPAKSQYPSEEEIVETMLSRYKDRLDAAMLDLVEALSKMVASAALEILIARSDAADES